MNIDITDFKKERNDALISLDKNKIIRFAKKYNVQLPKNEEAFWIGIHKAITGITDIPKEMRMKSIKWLSDRGYSNFSR